MEEEFEVQRDVWDIEVDEIEGTHATGRRRVGRRDGWWRGTEKEENWTGSHQESLQLPCLQDSKTATKIRLLY